MLWRPPQFRPVGWRPRDFRPSDARSYWLYQRPSPTGPDTVLAVLAPGTDEYELSGDPNSEVYVYPRTMSRCGVFDNEPIPPKIQRVAFDGNGDLILPVPNAPTGLRVVPLAGGELEARWGYASSGQAAAPAQFNVYRSTDGGATFALVESVSATGARRYSHSVGTFAHEQLVIVRVRAASADGAEEQNTADVAAIADAEAPAAPQGMSWEVQRE